MRIRLTNGDQSATVTLLDNATARDFASLLPFTLTMHDLFGREKAGPLPRALASDGEPQSTYRVGDVGYWSPSNDLAIYYDDDGETIPSPGIIMIGTVDSGLDVIASVDDSFQLTIDAVA
ncbi:MAG: cyclophilin-like fold protein [Acidimicrobiia bacterium]